MATRRSAGLLLYRRSPSATAGIEVLIGHMGGPFWARRDERAWSIPKGEYDDTEEPLAAAMREFAEELGIAPPPGPYAELGALRQSTAKIITIWAVEADLDPAAVVPGTFTMEWPRGSGRMQGFPEIDRVAWLGPDVARVKVVAGQAPFIDRLLTHLAM